MITRHGPTGYATFSNDLAFRYALARRWDERRADVLFVMFNPSAGDEAKLDPTLRRCASFAAAWGYGGFAVANLFALRSPHVRTVARHAAPAGPDNEAWLTMLTGQADLVVVAWGALAARYRPHTWHVAQLLGRHAREPLRCLGMTKDGHPRHPLYLRKSTSLEVWA